MEDELERQRALAEEEKRQQGEELRRDKEKEFKESEQGETRKIVDFGTGQNELPPLDIPLLLPSLVDIFHSKSWAS